MAKRRKEKEEIMDEKYIYATKFEFIISLISLAFVMSVLYVTNADKKIMLLVLIFMLAIVVITYLSYKGKIPLRRIVE